MAPHTGGRRDEPLQLRSAGSAHPLMESLTRRRRNASSLIHRSAMSCLSLRTMEEAIPEAPMTSGAASGPRVARPPRPGRRGATSGRAMALPLIVGVLIGASILGASVSAVPRTQGPGGDGSPPFTLWLNLNNSSLTGGVYFYVFSVSLSPWVNVTAQWTQFYVYAPSSWREVPVNVTLLSGSGSSLARFDSSLSSWKSNGINGSFPPPGGGSTGRTPRSFLTTRSRLRRVFPW